MHFVSGFWLCACRHQSASLAAVCPGRSDCRQCPAGRGGQGLDRLPSDAVFDSSKQKGQRCWTLFWSMLSRDPSQASFKPQNVKVRACWEGVDWRKAATLQGFGYEKLFPVRNTVPIHVLKGRSLKGSLPPVTVGVATGAVLLNLWPDASAPRARSFQVFIYCFILGSSSFANFVWKGQHWIDFFHGTSQNGMKKKLASLHSCPYMDGYEGGCQLIVIVLREG